MEKPYLNLPNKLTLPKLPQVYLPKVALPKLQGVPLPGTSEFYYKQAEEERDKRASQFFNSNNPNEVNSWADVITNTATDLFTAVGNADFMGIMNAVGNTVIDSWNLLNRGTIQPILNRDMDVLKSNTWINFMETADILDNLWKGFAIPIVQDKRGFNAGIEGFKGALFGRENYNWDTGSTAMDLIMEMATPTNLFMLGSTSLVKGAGKAAFIKAGGAVEAGKLGVDAGTTISKKAMKTFSRAYTGDAGAAIRTVAEKYHISPAAASILQDVAVHSKTMKIIASLNKVTKVVDAVDSFGPKIAIRHTFMPLKLIYHGGKWGINMVNKYMADALARSSPYESVIQYVANEGKLLKDMTAIEAAAKINGEEFDVTIINKVLSDISRKDLREFDNVFRTAYNAAYRTDIDSIIEGTTATATTIKSLSDALDEAALKLAGGLEAVKNFDDYFAIIQRLQYTKRGNSGLESLYKSLYRMRNVRDGLRANTLAMHVDDLKVIVDVSYLKRNAGLRETLTELENRLELYLDQSEQILDLNYPQAKKFVRMIDGAYHPLTRDLQTQYDLASRFVNDVDELRGQIKYNDGLIKAIERGDVPDEMKMFDVETLAAIETHIDTIEAGLKDIYYLTEEQTSMLELIDDIHGLINAGSIENSIEIGNKLEQLNQLVMPKAEIMSGSEAFQHYFKQALPLDNVQKLIDELTRLSEQAEGSPVHKGHDWKFDVEDAAQRKKVYVIAKQIDDALVEFDELEDIALPDILAEMRSVLERIRTIREALKPEDKVPVKEWGNIIDAFRSASNALRSRMETLAYMEDDIIKTDVLLQNELSSELIERYTNDLAYTYRLSVKEAKELIEKNRHFDDIKLSIVQVRETLRNYKQMLKELEESNLSHKETRRAFLGMRIKQYEAADIYPAFPAEYGEVASKDVIEHWAIKSLVEDIENAYDRTLARKMFDQRAILTSDLYKSIFEMQDLLLPEAHYVVEGKVGDYVKEYVFQTAKLFKSLQLVNTPEMGKILDAMESYVTEDSGVEIIRMLAKLPRSIEGMSEVVDKAQRVLTTLEGLTSVRNFYGEVIKEMKDPKSPLSVQIGLRYLDALQTFYNRPAMLVDELYPSQDWWINKVLDNVEEQVSNVNKWFNAKLDKAVDFIEELATRAELKPHVQALYDKYKGPHHKAYNDVRMNYVVDVFYGRTYLGFHPLYEDIETTTLNSHQGVILQDALFDAFTGRTYSLVNINAGPPDTMISDTVYSILYDMDDLDNAKLLYNKIHIEGDIETIHKQFDADDPTIELILCNGEAELLRVRDNIQKGIRDTGPPIKTVMWNGINFDSKYLNTKIALYDKEFPEWQLKYMSANEIEDTRIWVEDHNGITRLNMANRDRLYELTEHFLNMRKSEITHITMELPDMVKMNRTQIKHMGKFIPSIDPAFRQDLDDLLNQLDGINLDTPQSGEVIQLFEDIRGGMNGMPHMANIRAMQRGVIDTLKSFKKTDRFLNNIHTDTEIAQFFADSAFFKNMPDYMTSKENITAMIEHYLSNSRVPHGVINVKLISDPELMLNWLKLDGVKLTGVDREKVLDLARNVQRTAEHVDYVDKLAEQRDNLLPFIKEVLDIIQESLGTHYFSTVEQYLRVDDVLVKQFAVARELYKMAHNLADGQKLLNSEKFTALEKQYDKGLLLWIRNPDLLRWQPDEDADLFHHLSYMNDDMQKVADYLEPIFEGEIDSVEAFIKHGDDTVRTAKLKRVATMFRPILEVFHNVHRIADKFGEDVAARAEYYNNLRLTFESYDNQMAYAKLREFLNMDPETMRRYLWQYSQEYVLTTRNALFSDNYFKMRNALKSEDIIKSDELFVRFQEILKNKQAYEELGIKVHVRGDDILFKLDYDHLEDIDNLEPLHLLEDYLPPFEHVPQALRNLLRDVGEDGAAEKLVDSIIEARRAMIDLTSDGMTTTFEKMDLGVFKEIDKRVGGLSGYLPTTDELLRHNRFDHSMFNHSVLGDVDSRRRFMPGTSFNPIKRMYNAMSMAHNKVASQDQFLATAMDESTTIDKFIRSTRDKEALVEYMKTNYMQTRLVFMAAHAKKGYELKTIYINNVDDVDFAIKMHAVPMDINTFNKAYQLINRNRVPEGWRKFVDKMFVVPYKIGYLALNPAFIMRNIIDAGLKNIITAGDLAILPQMFKMTGTYVQYKHTTQTILNYARYSGKSARYAAEDIFNGTAKMEGKPVTATVSRDDYELINMFKIDGASTGLVAEMKREMGDAVDKIYHRMGREQGTFLDPKTFRMIMEAPDAVAEGILKRYFPSADASRFIMNEKRRLYFYKRGYEMLKHYPKADISVDEIVMYLQRPDRVLPQHQKAMDMMLEKTKNFSMNQDLYDKVMSHPLLATTMDLNGGVEEIMRLTLFKYMIESGASYSQATAAVVKTHFDYAHKSQMQMYMEMLFPFSTFRINNLLYWMDALSHHPQLTEAVRDTADSVFGVNDYTPEQREWYKGLDYHITAGNIRFTRDQVSAWGIEIPKGQEMALKVNSSVMDVFEFATDPYNYIANALNTTVQTVQDLYELKPYEGETDASFKNRKDKLIYQLMPIIGPHLLRMKAKFSDNPMVNLVMAPFFSLLKVPQPYTPYVKRYYKYKPFKKFQYSKARRYRLPYISRPNRLYYSTYSTFNKWYYGTPTIRRNGMTYMAQNSRSWNRTFSDIHGRSVSRTGRPKYRFLGFPTDKWTMPIKIALLRNISNHIRYSY